jgi:hypothetical protein
MSVGEAAKQEHRETKTICTGWGMIKLAKHRMSKRNLAERQQQTTSSQ